MDNEKFIFTPDNLIENIHKIGAWSIYGLATEALQHYFPDEYGEDKSPSVKREVEMCHELGCEWWQDVVIKYQTEVGYDAPNGFNTEAVNEY